MFILKPGQPVRTETSQRNCAVESFLGGGSQGEVYRTALSEAPLALKWYYPASATSDQRSSLEMLIKKGSPSDRFLWPIELASASGILGFGYLMPLREKRFRGIADLMKRRIDPSFRALATAGFELAHNYLQLHAQGLCYRDISFGNVFLDPDTGQVLICDNDNVAIDSDQRGGILGTPRFMAPEVVRGEANPGTQTDLFSLAVLLFYMFVMHHPLEGRRELVIHSFDLPAMTKLYGREPLFVFHPADSSNEPIPGHHDNALRLWPIYPKYLRDLFTRAFTDGIDDPQHGRVREGEWRAAMIKLRDSILYCAHCGAENFYDADALKSSGGQSGICWNCNRRIQLPYRLRIGRHTVMLNYDSALYPHHLDEQRPYDFSYPAASIVRHPEREDLWGLRNCTQDTWSFWAADTTSASMLNPGKSVTLTPGLRIQFGKQEGLIRI